MSATAPRIPSPADLARARRPPTPPRPSRGRRLAGIEKERAHRTLRSSVADPATDFAVLDADEFFAALRCACEDGTLNLALIADVRRRLDDGSAAARGLHQVLLAAGGGRRVAGGPSCGDGRRRPATPPRGGGRAPGGPAPRCVADAGERVVRRRWVHRARVARS